MSGWYRLLRATEASPRLLIGLMSGTSADGTDAALVRITDAPDQTTYDLQSFVSRPFPTDLRERVLAVARGEGNAEAVSRLSVALAEEYALAVADLLAEAGVDAVGIAAIGCHGQTVSHTPHGTHPATLQIGDSSTLAIRSGIPVVSHFRGADIAAGGQGAPLTPYADWKLLTHSTRNRAIQNIGGIANVTYLTASGAANQVVGFDTGPGNMLIDLASQWARGDRSTYDRDGLLALAGTVLPELLEWLLGNPFQKLRPPKSAGREEFGAGFWAALQRRPEVVGKRPEDIVATVTAFTARSITLAYADYLPKMPDEVIVSGGGARNPALMQFFTAQMVPVPVLTSESLGINPQAREAIAFALLADETLHGRPANLPAVTGATHAVVLGSVTLTG